MSKKIKEDGENETSGMGDQIISFLKPQYPTTYLLFLEHLVIETELQIEKYHTQLALAYLENIRKMPLKLCLDKANIEDFKGHFCAGDGLTFHQNR